MKTRAETVDPLLFYFMLWKVIHGHLWRHCRQNKIWFVFTVLSITSLMNVIPHGKFTERIVGSWDMYFQVCFLRNLDRFDVKKIFLPLFYLVLWLSVCFSPTSKELTVILKKLVLNMCVLLTGSSCKICV